MLSFSNGFISLNQPENNVFQPTSSVIPDRFNTISLPKDSIVGSEFESISEPKELQGEAAGKSFVDWK